MAARPADSGTPRRREGAIADAQRAGDAAAPAAAGTKRSRALANEWLDADVTSTAGATRAALESLYALADAMGAATRARRPLAHVLAGRVVALCFLEPSTRTCTSFSAAAQRLGASVVQVNASDSSVAKGETLADTVRTLESYADAVVLRHPRLGAAAEAAAAMRKPLVNAGDGAGEHPTQALLDLYTILREPASERVLRGGDSPLHVTFLGDARYGRTVHSLARLLANYAPSRFRVRYVAPDASLTMPGELVAELRARGMEQSEHAGLDHDVLAHTHVLYVTRVQKERFADADAYERAKASFHVDRALLARFARAADVVVMHPLPRVGEIAEDVDSDPRAAYFRQMENGMFVRMALLASVLGGEAP